jgi:hypothetical protein
MVRIPAYHLHWHRINRDNTVISPAECSHVSALIYAFVVTMILKKTLLCIVSHTYKHTVINTAVKYRLINK